MLRTDGKFSVKFLEKNGTLKKKKGRNQIVLKTMPSGTDNPVDDFYFLHNLSKIGDYLNYLFRYGQKINI